MSEPVITVRGLGKRYRIGSPARYGSLRESLLGAARRVLVPAEWRRQAGGQEIWALKDASFDIQTGEVVGVVGRNGAGKSTLLKILARVTEPTTGFAEIRGRVGTLLEVGTGFHPELTGRDNILVSGAILGMQRREVLRKLDEIAAFAEVERFLETPVKHYSTGMYMRLAFAVAAHLDADILLVDEVLAVGDVAFQRKCVGKMRAVAEGGRTVIFVSHDMAAVQRLCGRAILVSDGTCTPFDSVRDAIQVYLGGTAVSERAFDDGPLRSISVNQDGDALVIRGTYDVSEPITLPCLGFLISDEMGAPICASNPLLNPPVREQQVSQRGTVEARLTQPKLLNGRYRLSIWFGNGQVDWLTLPDCVTFDVVNMASVAQRPGWTWGRVFPDCEWTFGPHWRR